MRPSSKWISGACHVWLWSMPSGSGFEGFRGPIEPVEIRFVVGDPVFDAGRLHGGDQNIRHLFVIRAAVAESGSPHRGSWGSMIIVVGRMVITADGVLVDMGGLDDGGRFGVEPIADDGRWRYLAERETTKRLGFPDQSSPKQKRCLSVRSIKRPPTEIGEAMTPSSSEWLFTSVSPSFAIFPLNTIPSSLTQ